MDVIIGIVILIAMGIYYLLMWILKSWKKREKNKLDEELKVFDPQIDNLLEESFDRNPEQDNKMNFQKESGVFTNGKINHKMLVIVGAGALALWYFKKKR